MKQVLDERLWRRVERLLPKSPPRPKGGRPRASDRACLEGILYSLRTGCPWEHLPRELGVSGMTCWRRLRDWHGAGVWSALRLALLDALGREGRVDWSRASVDSASLGAKRGGQDTGPSPVDRGKPGTKRHLIVDARGLPVAALLSGANRHDSLFLLPLLDAVPAVASRRGPRRRRPERLHADEAYDHRRLRKAVQERGVACRIARKGVESSERLGRRRWVVERTLSWVSRFRRLAIRYERRADVHLALTILACAIICWKKLEGFC